MLEEVVVSCMAKIVLFSAPTPKAMSKVCSEIFPLRKNASAIFIPANGFSRFKDEYREFWSKTAHANGYSLDFVDLEATDQSQNIKKLRIQAL